MNFRRILVLLKRYWIVVAGIGAAAWAIYTHFHPAPSPAPKPTPPAVQAPPVVINNNPVIGSVDARHSPPAQRTQESATTITELSDAVAIPEVSKHNVARRNLSGTYPLGVGTPVTLAEGVWLYVDGIACLETDCTTRITGPTLGRSIPLTVKSSKRLMSIGEDYYYFSVSKIGTDSVEIVLERRS